MKLIESSVTPLQVSTSPRILSGEFATFNERNQNGRIYPGDIYRPAIDKLMEKVRSRTCLGECDHPIDYDEVRLSNVSHLITDLRVEGNKVYGKVELLNTPAGKVVQALCEAGVPIGISSRAVGDIRVDGDTEYVESCDLITYDLVADPSFKSAYLTDSAKSKLGESLRLVESKLPSVDKGSSSNVSTLINGIKESLLVDSHKESDRDPHTIDTRDMEIESLRKILESKMSDIKTMSESHQQKLEDLAAQRSILSSDVKRLSTSIKEHRAKESELTKRLGHLNSNMHKIQEAYNSLHETTVSRKDYEGLQAEVIDLRKRLVVESKGLSYSQVRKLLEGATTTQEIEDRLMSMKPQRTLTVLSDLPKVAQSLNENVRKQDPLASIISKV